MGWGAKRAVAPQPDRSQPMDGDAPIIEEPPLSETMATTLDAPDPNRKAMVESIGLMSSKGWLAERKLQALHDYLKARALFADFNTFIRRMR